jgi:hypothetical protein
MRHGSEGGAASSSSPRNVNVIGGAKACPGRLAAVCEGKSRRTTMYSLPRVVHLTRRANRVRCGSPAPRWARFDDAAATERLVTTSAVDGFEAWGPMLVGRECFRCQIGGGPADAVDVLLHLPPHRIFEQWLLRMCGLAVCLQPLLKVFLPPGGEPLGRRVGRQPSERHDVIVEAPKKPGRVVVRLWVRERRWTSGSTRRGRAGLVRPQATRHGRP